MATEKLYYGDAYLSEFSAVVLSCAEGREGWLVTLDRSAFYPEGGGQPGDTGLLGGVTVTDTHEKNGEILHYCTAPLPVGSTVDGVVDRARRLDLMQQHSGEHIVSGIICGMYGCDNVGFHLGADTVVIDFNHPIPPEALADIEAAANAVIWENRPFLVRYPDAAELAALPYRSKKELEGQIRIVECPGADCCACCGTHVNSAGELGLIKLLSLKPFRGGVRIEMLSGRRAYRYVSDVAEQNRQISVLLSAKVDSTAAAVQRLQEELAAARFRLVGFENRLFAEKAAALAGAGDLLLFEDGLSPDALRRCCDEVAACCGGRCAVFSGTDETGYKYAVGLRDGDLRSFVKTMNTALNGRGGGKPEFVQGSLAAKRSEIEAFFAAQT